MMRPFTHKSTLVLIAMLVPLAVLFIYVVLRSGPLAPVPVVVATVDKQAITPALFGVGIMEARYTHRIGPVAPGRILQVHVDVGDRVQSGQLLGDIDPVDLDERIKAQESALQRINANILAAEARVRDMSGRKDYARSQARRYDELLGPNLVSEELAGAKRQEFRSAEAGLTVSEADLEALHRELARLNSELNGLTQQRKNLRLESPVEGTVVARYADPGTTLVAGQPVVAIIDTDALWITVRFDQLHASGLKAGLPARIALRSRANDLLAGKVLRVEPVADAVTEETLAKVVFDSPPDPLPPLGELAEVTVSLPELPERPVIPNASLHRINGQPGVWVIENGDLRYAPVLLGVSDLDGRVQVLEGLKTGDRVVVYSSKALNSRSRIKIMDRLPGVAP
jgi:RND family efflux transporter MFP subunit